MCWGSADPHITLSQGSAEGVLSFPHSYDEDVMMMMWWWWWCDDDDNDVMMMMMMMMMMRMRWWWWFSDDDVAWAWWCCLSARRARSTKSTLGSSCRRLRRLGCTEISKCFQKIIAYSYILYQHFCRGNKYF